MFKKMNQIKSRCGDGCHVAPKQRISEVMAEFGLKLSMPSERNKTDVFM